MDFGELMEFRNSSVHSHNWSGRICHNVTEEQTNQFKVIVDVFVVSCLCAFGFVGNALTILVLFLDREKANTTNWLLQSLAVADSLYLVACIFIQPIKTISLVTDWIPSFIYMQPYVLPTASCVQTMTVWLILLVTVDRYMAVCRPFNNKFRSQGAALLSVLVTVLLSVFYNLPLFFEKYVGIPEDSCTKELKVLDKPFVFDAAYFTIYRNLMYLVFRTVGPLITLIVLNILLIKSLKKIRQKHAGMTKTSTHKENITLMLIVVISVFIACELPDTLFRLIVCILELKARWHNKHFNDTSVFMTANSFTNMLLTVNSSVNFIIYCLVGKKFRRILRQLFTNCSKEAQSPLPETELLTFPTVANNASSNCHT